MKQAIRNSGSILLAAAALLFLGGTTAHAGDAEVGKALFLTNCLSCHGETGKGDGPVGAALDPKPRDFSVGDFAFDADKDGTPGSDADLTLVIKNGAGEFGGSLLMAPWGHLSDGDIENLVAFIRTLKK